MRTAYLFETHMHTSEVSECGHVPAREMIQRYAENGFGGVEVTDHFLPGRFTSREKREVFLRGYREAADEGVKRNVVVLPAMEIRFSCGPEDYLVLGMEERELLDDIPDTVCDMKINAFHLFCTSHGWLFYQAHPFRPGLSVRPAAWLDGVETINGNPRHNSHNDLALQYADAYDLMTLAGSDAHQPEDIAVAGIWIPQEALTSKTLVSYLRTIRKPSFYTCSACKL